MGGSNKKTDHVKRYTNNLFHEFWSFINLTTIEIMGGWSKNGKISVVQQQS